jgi:hypothetical protein
MAKKSRHQSTDAGPPTVPVSWSADKLSQQMKSKRRGYAGTLPEGLHKLFGKKSSSQEAERVVGNACHVADKDGKMLLVYLPGLLRKDQEQLLDDAVFLLGNSRKSQFVTKKDGHWRSLQVYFQPAKVAGVPVGVASYSPSWFSSGHPVRCFALSDWEATLS